MLLSVISSGALKGFVSVCPRWNGINRETPLKACESVYEDDELDQLRQELRIWSGEEHSNVLSISFTGYQVPRGIYFLNRSMPALTITNKSIEFNKACHDRLDNCEWVEMLYHPILQAVVLREGSPDHTNSFRWVTDRGKNVVSTSTGWSLNYRQIGDGVNLVTNSSSEWSEWLTPEYSRENRCFTIGKIELGDKAVGDAYTCQIEIEYMDIEAQEGQKFAFWTQGAVDNTWDKGNIWNGKLVSLNAVPLNGVYKYTHTEYITEKNVGQKIFDLGFRCDYWANGKFRYRCVKVEKGAVATE